MKKDKQSLFKILAFWISGVFFLLTLLFIGVNYGSDYYKFLKEKNELSKNHTEKIKQQLKKEVEHYVHLISIQKKSYMDNQKEILKRRVEKAYLEIQNLYERYKGKKSLQEIQEIAITVLRKVRFPNSGYYFIIKTNGTEILNDPQKELEGKNLISLYNSDGVYVANELIKFIEDYPQGWFAYKWPKPHEKFKTSKNQIGKISYLKLFKPFDWVIGTGFYQDDLTKNIQDEILKNKELLKFDLNSENYIFIGNWDGVSQAYPVKGKNMYDIQDKNGKYIVRELIQKAKDGGGFVKYVMPSLENEQNKNKISYVMAIPEWQWYVGAGAYLDDIQQQINLLEKQLFLKLVKNSLITFIASIFMIALFLLFFKNITKKVQRDFNIFKQFFDDLVEKNKKINLDAIRFEKFAPLALHANQMLEEKIALEDSLNKYKLIVSISHDYLCLLDKKHIYRAVNDTFIRACKKTKDEIIGHSISNVLGEEFFKNYVEKDNARVLQGESFTVERWVDFSIGKRCLEIAYYPYKENQQDEVEYFVAVARDITQKKDTEEEVFLWNKVFENIAEAILICDEELKIQLVNKAFINITGYKADEAIGEKLGFMSLGGLHNTEVGNVCTYIKEYRQWSGEIKNVTKTGKVYPALLSASAIINEEGNVKNYLIVFSDITMLKESQEQLHFLEQHDTLTGLPNRVLLKDRIMHAIENAKRTNSMVAIFFLDLDNFKKVNDTYGHTYGDEVLKETARRIRSQIKQTDTISRIGGDEFILLLEHLYDVTDVEEIAKKLLLTVEEPYVINSKQFFLSVSIGISQYPQNSSNADTLIKNADIAMYKSKNSGKNMYRFFTNDMSSQTHHDLDTENALKLAIQEKQFVVFYQPQINLKTGEVDGFEALIRWQHPIKGILSPLHFIKLAEDTKMIIPIGEYVFTKACEDLLILQKEYGFTGRVSINVSGIQIEFSDFFNFLTQSIQKTKVDPSKIEVEITESVIMSDPKSWIEILNSIKSLGMQIAIDDFGTGYSSLSYLRKLPIDKLKIDMSFVRDIPYEEDACAIANSIINLSDNMRMITLAEGIETKEQEEYLKQNNCEEGQGYLYAKPMNLSDTIAWLKNR